MHVQKADKIHGILFMALFSFAAFYLGELPIFKSLSISPLIIGIVLGMIYANTLRMHLPNAWNPGIKFTSKTILRTAIVFFGFRLTLTQIAEVGLHGTLVDICIVTSVILLGLLIGKLLKIDTNQAILISSGSAICGAAAVLGTEPVLDDKPYKTVVAVSTVVIFGTIAMFLYPSMYRAGWLSGMTDHQVAIYTGSTLHEVAHVAGAGAAMNNPEIAGLATITKVIRVILLAPFLLILGYFVNRRKKATGEISANAKVQIPWFAVLFLVVVAINTGLTYLAGNMGMSEYYDSFTHAVKWLDTFALTMAMTALGCDAEIAKFKEAGLKPFIMALILFAWLVFGGYAIVKLLVI